MSRSFQPSGRTLAFHLLKLTRSFFDKGRRSIQVYFGGSGRSHLGRGFHAGPCRRRLGQRRRNHCGCIGSFINHLAYLGSLGNLAQFILEPLKKTGWLRGAEDSSSGDRLWLKVGKSEGRPGLHSGWNALLARQASKIPAHEPCVSCRSSLPPPPTRQTAETEGILHP